MKKTKTQKGITLIALIVTVSVLIILTSVVITTVTNDEIKDNTKNTVSAFEILQEKEKLQNEVMRWDLINNNDVPTLQNYMAGIYGEENVQLNVDNSLTVTVPSGNRYIVTKEGEVTLIDETITEPEVNNISVSLDKTEISKEITNGKAVTETITATLNNATGKLTWLSSDPDVAQIATSEGNERIIKLKQEGTATITVAYAENKNIASVCTIEVIQPINITLDKTTINKAIIEGDTATETITATLDVEGKTVTWSSSNTSVASVEGNGNTATITLKGIGNATITASCGKYSASCTVTVTEIKVAQIGDYVEYNVPYTDMSSAAIEYTSETGWRFLGRDENNNVLLISTGIPLVLCYRPYTGVGTSNIGWWGTDSQVSSEFGATYATGYSNYPNRYAAYGLRYNLEKITYIHIDEFPTTTSPRTNKMTGMFSGSDDGTIGTTFRANNILSEKILQVRTLTLAEFNQTVNKVSGTSRTDDAITSWENLQGVATGLFDLEDLDSGYDNSSFSEYGFGYWLASPYTGEAGSVHTPEASMLYVQCKDEKSTIWKNQTNATTLDYNGVRPIIVLSSDVKLLDADEDGVFEIKY